MKKYFRFAYLCIASLAVASCVFDNPVEPDEPKVEEIKMVEVSFGAETYDPAQTKATLTPNAGETAFQAEWVSSDAISIYYLNPNADGGEVTGEWNSTSHSFKASFPVDYASVSGEWQYEACYPTAGSDVFGDSRLQTGNAYNSQYDIMLSSVNATGVAGKDGSKDVVFKMERQTAIAYFHLTSSIDEALTSATLTVTGGNIASNNASLTTSKFTATANLDHIDLNLSNAKADDFTLWFNVLPGSYSSMSLTVTTVSGKTATISRNTSGSYAKGKLYKVVKDVTFTGGSDTSSWQLVTDASTLSVGDKVVIAAKDDNYAISTTQNTNNRGQAPITKQGNLLSFDHTADVQVFTLEAGTKTNTWAFYTGSQYIYASSSSSNQLKSKNDKDNNASWEITINNDNEANIIAQGSYTHNIIRYNAASDLFSCYASGQGAVALYKSVDGRQSQSLSFAASSVTWKVGEDCELNTPKAGQTVSGSNTTVTYSSSDETVATVDASTGVITPIKAGETTITASTDGDDTYASASASYALIVSVIYSRSYSLVNSESELGAGDVIVLGCADKSMAAGAMGTNSYFTAVNAVVTDKVLSSDEAIEITLGGNSADGWTFTTSEGTVGATAAKSLSVTSGTTTWSISISSTGVATITNTSSSCGSIKYNASAPRFLNYASGQTSIEIYRKPSVPKVLTSISIEGQNTSFEVGDPFTVGSGIVTAHYEDNSSKEVTSSASFSGYNMSTSGVQTVTVTYEEGGVTKTVTYDITVNPQTVWDLTEISVKTAPTKVSYVVGDNLDLSGMVVSATYKDHASVKPNKSVDLTSEQWVANPSNGTQLTTTGTVQVTITFDGKTCTQDVTVSAAPSIPEYDSLAALVAAGDPTGNPVIVSFSDMTITRISVSKDNLRNGIFLLVGDKEIEIYHNGVPNDWVVGGTVSATSLEATWSLYYSTWELIITDWSDLQYVAPLELVSISVKTEPAKTTYMAGETFDPSGLVITKSMSDSGTEDVAYSDHEDDFTFTPSLSTPLVSSNETVTISYGGKSTTQAISVSAGASYTLTLTQTTGGNITAYVGGQPVVTGASIEANSTVTITATPTTGYTFTSWALPATGLASSTSATTTFTMTADTEVKATFTAQSGGGSDPVTISWSRSGSTDTTTSGYSLYHNLKSSTSGYYQDNSKEQTYYLQVSGTNPMFPSTPSSISFTATLGGGTSKDPLGDGRVYVALVDNEGAVISGTETEVTNKITATTGSAFTVSIPVTSMTSAYGFKLYHSKISGYNVRFFSASITIN